MTVVREFLAGITELTGGGRRPEGMVYATPHEFILARGRAHVPASLPTDVRRGKPGCCYRNAWRAVVADPTLTYVEGYATTRDVGVPLAHAWATRDGETAIDPTWKDGADYYGVAFPTEWLVRKILVQKVFGLLGHENARDFLSGRWDDLTLGATETMSSERSTAAA